MFDQKCVSFWKGFLMTKKINWPYVIRSYLLWGVMPVASIFVFGYALELFLPDDPESIEKREWCEEYHPEKTGNECAKIAGW